MATYSCIVPIPSPPGVPLLGHINAIDKEMPARSFALLNQTYGGIYSLTIFGRKMIIVGVQALVTELCDEKRFYKKVDGALEQVRNAAGDGLFTAYHGEDNWGPAHRLLMPAFGPGAIREMFDDMLDINAQLLLKWDRFGSDYVIDPVEDFTRLAFDTIALCAMSYRFNSFYQPDLPPFMGAMGRFLTQSGARASTPTLLQSWMSKANAEYEADIKLMHGICDSVIAYRKEHPTDKKDLLGVMLTGKDTKTGKGLSEENIRYQLLTFLIAGHETTSGMLSFAMYYLISTPSAYAAVQREVDFVLGTEPICLSQLGDLKYITAVMRETLRLRPPAGIFKVAPYEDTLLGGKYEIKKGQPCAIDATSLHRDPKVWGDDAEEFKPERMLDGKFGELPPNSWKPFGNGSRACIGRPFAWQEAQMMLATLFQKFDFRFHDPAYQLQLKQTLTLKPYGLRIHAVPRAGHRPIAHVHTPAVHRPTTHVADHKDDVAPEAKSKPLYIYFGSNSGSCQGFAQSVAADAGSQGYHAHITTLDSIESVLPTDGPVVILTASYEGQPADNAAHFVEWIKGLTGSELTGVNYAVFGAGNHDWVHTYQAVPTLIDNVMAERGAARMMDRFAADAGGPDLFGEFETWESSLWQALGKQFATSPVGAAQKEDFTVTVTGTSRTVRLRQPDMSVGRVIENRLLTPIGLSQKRHIEFELPFDMEYRAGDYLAILPSNPLASVKRVLHRFNLLPETKVAIKAAGPTTLPTDEPISVFEVFSHYVELSQPATKRNVEELLQLASPESATVKRIRDLSANYKTIVLDKRLSLLDLLELYPDVTLPLSQFIKMLPAMRIRQYSISSSPLWKADHVTLTISVVKAPAFAGLGEFEGVGSNYLANLKPGDSVPLAVRSSALQFHLPTETSRPVVMFCAGSGFAPMRGFIQERAEQIRAGREIGSALLFVGCHGPEEDFLYADAELGEWIAAGAVDVRPVFSRHPEMSVGCKYVQDRIWKERADVKKAYDDGARFYTCGMSGMSNGVRQRCIEMIQEDKQCSIEEAAEMFQRLSNERYSTDVFG